MPEILGEIRRRVSAGLPRPVEQVARRYYPVVLAALHRRWPVARLRGTSLAGRPATMIVAGPERRLNYLAERFFSGTPEAEPLGEYPSWQVERVVRRFRTEADMVAIRADRASARLFFRDPYTRVPAWIGMQVDPAPAGHMSRGAREDLRRIRRAGIGTEFGAGEPELREFYESFYVPLLERRHGEAAYVRDLLWLRERLRRGGLLWAVKDGARVAGELYEIREHTLSLCAIGLRNGELALAREGALAVLYHRMIEFARERGCTLVDMGLVRPSLKDGLLRYKAKWGAAVSERPENYYLFLVHWNAWNPAVSAFFAATPLVHRSPGGLSAIAVSTAAEPPETVQRNLAVEGLEHLAITPACETGVAANCSSEL